ncbi:MAG: hypothetical protein J0L93_03810 [Deltaproteobacteria bacterium]|nr:hypothetical protein [Deltaproteobacteria bacterium]
MSILSIVLGLVISAPTSEFVESKLQTPSGLLERIVYEEDERDFAVRLTKDDGDILWLEERSKQKFLGKIVREKISLFSDVGFESVILKTEKAQHLLGLAPKEYHSHCSATANVFIPTPLSEKSAFDLENLECNRANEPAPSFEWLKVLGRDNRSWLQCEIRADRCEWNSNYPEQIEAAAEISSLVFLTQAQQKLNENKLNAFLPKLTVKSLFGFGNQSTYNPESQTLFYGSGKFPDALDGFVVVHEWAHALINQLNPSLYGYQASVLHEALADFYAAQLFDSACFAPFDAQEDSNLKCMRDLQTEIHFPNDFDWADSHKDSLAVSGALWEAKKYISSEILTEMILESLIRSPKRPDLADFWKKLEGVYARIVIERNITETKSEDLHQIGKRWGFVKG